MTGDLGGKLSADIRRGRQPTGNTAPGAWLAIQQVTSSEHLCRAPGIIVIVTEQVAILPMIPPGVAPYWALIA